MFEFIFVSKVLKLAGGVLWAIRGGPLDILGGG